MLLLTFTLTSLITLSSANTHDPNHHLNNQDDLSHWPESGPSTPYTLPKDPLPLSTREFWMRRAILALSELNNNSCPFAAFGAVIVNHTASAGASESWRSKGPDGLGTEVCTGVNSIVREGNPTLHGE